MSKFSTNLKSKIECLIKGENISQKLLSNWCATMAFMSMILCHIPLNKMVMLSDSLGLSWIKHRQCIFTLAFLILIGSLQSCMRHIYTTALPNKGLVGKCPMSFYIRSHPPPLISMYLDAVLMYICLQRLTMTSLILSPNWWFILGLHQGMSATQCSCTLIIPYIHQLMQSSMRTYSLAVQGLGHISL